MAEERIKEETKVNNEIADEIAEEAEALIQTLCQKQEDFDNCANLSLPDPGLVKYFRSYAKRIIWLEEEIDDDTIDVTNSIIEWNIRDERAKIPIEERIPIKIYINSPGGLLNVTFSICDVIKASKTPVYGINIGEANSAASMIFACCHKRMAMKNSSFLLHLGSGGTYGTYQQTKAQQRHYEHLIKQMKATYLEQLTITEDELEELIDQEWYLYTDDFDENSKENPHRYNLVTEIITDLTRLAI